MFSRYQNTSFLHLWIIYTVNLIAFMLWSFVNDIKGRRRPQGKSAVKQSKVNVQNIPPRVFPAELERDIFERAVLQYPKNAPKFARVARRVQLWVEPMMYADVVLNHWYPYADSEMVRLFLRTIESRPPSFFAKHVKSLYLNVHTHEAGRVIAVCTGVQNIVCSDALWSLIPGQNMRLPQILSLSPRRLSVSLKRIFPSPHSFDFRHPLFANMTHLQITNRLTSEMWPRFCPPRLTHLALPYSPGCDPTDHIIKKQVREILSSCPTIQALVLTTSDRDSAPRLLMSDEPRAVIVYCRASRLEFASGANGEDDFWTRAELFLALHRYVTRSDSFGTCSSL